jgi:hypothetical protein
MSTRTIRNDLFFAKLPSVSLFVFIARIFLVAKWFAVFETAAILLALQQQTSIP